MYRWNLHRCSSTHERILSMWKSILHWIYKCAQSKWEVCLVICALPSEKDARCFWNCKSLVFVYIKPSRGEQGPYHRNSLNCYLFFKVAVLSSRQNTVMTGKNNINSNLPFLVVSTPINNWSAVRSASIASVNSSCRKVLRQLFLCLGLFKNFPILFEIVRSMELKLDEGKYDNNIALCSYCDCNGNIL